jgi:3-oxoacyl-[acyl-carrier protein] reductase
LNVAYHDSTRLGFLLRTFLSDRSPAVLAEHQRNVVMSSRILEGKVALVTGAGRGLGRAFAEHLASLGCSVGVHGMRENGPAEYGEGTTLTQTALEIGQTHGVRTCRVLGDLTNHDHVKQVVSSVCSELGPIDILVHNAG